MQKELAASKKQTTAIEKTTQEYLAALDARVQLALAIRRLRETQELSQKDLAARLKTRQPRIAKIERAASDVSLDQLVRAFTAAGGRITVRSAATKRGRQKKAGGKRSDTLVLEVGASK